MRYNSAQQINHYDLKPANILRGGNVWKMTEFDPAQIVEDGE